MLIGYARVSTLDQNLALQRDALKAAGCRRIFADEGVSGSVTARRGLEAALTALSPGDTLVVWKLDRLGRSLSHLVTLIAELGARRVNFRSLSDPIDTASSGGRLVMHITGALAEFEREAAPRSRRGRMASGRTLPVRWLHCHKHGSPRLECRRLLQQARDLRAVDQRGQGHDSMDAAVMPLVRRQRRAAPTSCARWRRPNQSRIGR
jgi:hypothetical protein